MKTKLQRLLVNVGHQEREARVWLIALALLMCAGCVVALWGSRRTTGWWEGVLVDVGTTFLGVLVTVFFVEWLIEQHDRARWGPLSRQANLRLRTVATNLILAIERHHPNHEKDPEFLVPAWAFRVDSRNYLWRLYDNPRWIDHIRTQVLPDGGQVVDNMTPDALDSLHGWLDITDKALREAISLYGPVLSPSQLDTMTALIDLIPGEQRVVASFKVRLPTFPRPWVERYLELALALVEASPAKVPENWRPKSIPASKIKTTATVETEDSVTSLTIPPTESATDKSINAAGYRK
jgi:hypothetical protein